MRQDIQVVRESISRVVSMLTSRRIRCRQQGTRAYVAYNKDGSIQMVNLPYLPDDAGEDFIAAVQGYLDHEIGHVLHSDVHAIFQAKKAGTRIANLANIIEDVYVERKMTQTFRGSNANLEAVRKFYLEKIARPKIDAALKAGDTTSATGYATVIAFRAWGGQTIAQDFMKDPVIADLVKPIAERIGEDMIERIGKCNDSFECLELAKDVKKKMEERPKPPAPPPPPEPMPESSTDEGDDPSKGAEDHESDDGDPVEDPGTTSSEDDDRESGDHEPSEAETSAPKPGEVESVEGEMPPESPAEKEDTGPSHDEPEVPPSPTDDFEAPPEVDEDEDKGGDDIGPGASGAAPPESSAPETPDADLGDGLDDAMSDGLDMGDTEDEAGESGESGAPESAEDSGEGEEGAGGTDGTDEDSTLPAPTPEIDDTPDESMSSMFDEERDFDKDMGDALTKEASRELTESEYRIFSTDWDTLEPAPLAIKTVSAEQMIALTQPMIGVMQKSLERAMAAKSKRAWSAGQRKGRINTGSLFKVAIGDDRIFRQRFETLAKNTAVSLAVDCSASMSHNDRVGTAAKAAFALSSTLERIKVAHEVIGYTTRRNGELLAAMVAEKKAVPGGFSPDLYARNEALYMPVFKPFNERLSSENISRIAHLTEDPGWLRENVDGECIHIVAHRLRQQRAERRVLIVLSDGSPACPPGNGLASHLVKTVDELQASGIEVIGIGIQTQCVKTYYKGKSVVLMDIEDLATTVMAQITKLLLA